MFWNKKKNTSELDFYIRTVDNGVLKTKREIEQYIWHLEKEKKALTDELNAIKPILDDPNIKPPVSAKCDECKLAVFGPKHYMTTMGHAGTTQQLLGCRKNGLCDDFKPKEEE